MCVLHLSPQTNTGMDKIPIIHMAEVMQSFDTEIARKEAVWENLKQTERQIRIYKLCVTRTGYT